MVRNGGINEKWAWHFFRDHPLPVPLDARCLTGFLGTEDLIKMVFERCRFLLPVSRYEGLNISGGSPSWGQNSRIPGVRSCPFSVSCKSVGSTETYR